MTTREEAVQACLALPFAYEDYPFHDPNWTVLRHQENHKIFAAVYQHQGGVWMNLKAEPLAGDFWRQQYPAIVPAYHMNKKHWISVILDGSLADEIILTLIQDSFSLTAPKKKDKRNP